MKNDANQGLKELVLAALRKMDEFSDSMGKRPFIEHFDYNSCGKSEVALMTAIVDETTDNMLKGGGRYKQKN